ncbi:MAG: hypothetical protein AB1430_18640 [Pseudomonadota bacterium]
MKPLTSHMAPAHRRLPRPTLRQRLRHLCGVIAALSLLLVSTTAHAEPRLQRVGEQAPRATLEIVQTPRAGSADAQGQWHLQVVRWAGSRGLGLSMGMGATPAAHPHPYALHDRQAAPALVPEVGLRWRTGWQANRRLDLGAYGSFDPSAATPDDERRAYNARVELQFRESRSKFGVDLGNRALGLQLSGSSRLMLRAKHGGPMVYYRSTW